MTTCKFDIYLWIHCWQQGDATINWQQIANTGTCWPPLHQHGLTLCFLKLYNIISNCRQESIKLQPTSQQSKYRNVFNVARAERLVSWLCGLFFFQKQKFSIETVKIITKLKIIIIMMLCFVFVCFFFLKKKEKQL